MLYLTDSSTTYFHNISTVKCRQLLEGTEDFIMEIRKHQVQNDLNYIWVKITKGQKQIKTLNLKFTDSSQNVKELFFKKAT